MKKILFLIVLFFSPFFVFADELIPNAKSGILMEANTGKIIFEKNKDDKLSVASMTKMVAQTIILEEIEKGNIKWSDVVTVSRNASSMGGSQIYLEEGEKMTVEDLMKGISVASGNDATVTMAEYISGSEKKFVERMNKVVKDLGLKNTHFVNCTGLDEDDHYSTSYDMAIIARNLIINHSEILRFSSIHEDYLREGTDKKFWLVNTNKLINFYDGADGLKTGHTDDALYCLAGTAKRNNLRLISIVLGENDSKTRNKEVMEMLDYGFNNIKMNILKKKGSIVSKVRLDKANIKYLDLVTKDDLGVIEGIGEKKNYRYKIVLNKLIYPINKGNSVGKINVLYNNNIISSSDLICSKNIKKINYFKFLVNNLIGSIFGNDY